MGTRGTIRIRKAGKQVVLYNNKDSYPSRLGVEFLTAIQTMIEKHGLDRFIQFINAVRVVNQEDVENYSTPCSMADLLGIIETGSMPDMDLYKNAEDEEYNYVFDLDHQCVYIQSCFDQEYEEDSEEEALDEARRYGRISLTTWREMSRALDARRTLPPPPANATPLSGIPALIEKWKKY